MKVSEMMAILCTKQLDDELVCVFWDKETMAGYIDNDQMLLTDSVWNEVASDFEVGSLDLPIGNAIREKVDELMESNFKDLENFANELLTDQSLWEE